MFRKDKQKQHNDVVKKDNKKKEIKPTLTKTEDCSDSHTIVGPAIIKKQVTKTIYDGKGNITTFVNGKEVTEQKNAPALCNLSFHIPTEDGEKEVSQEELSNFLRSITRK